MIFCETGGGAESAPPTFKHNEWSDKKNMK